MIPRLAELNPRWREAVLRLSGLAREESDMSADLARTVAAAATISATENRLVLRGNGLPMAGSAARSAVLRSAWKRARWPERRMGRDDWRRLAALRRSAVDLPHGVRAVCDGETLTLSRPAPDGAAAPAGSAGPAAA